MILFVSTIHDYTLHSYVNIYIFILFNNTGLPVSVTFANNDLRETFFFLNNV